MFARKLALYFIDVCVINQNLQYAADVLSMLLCETNTFWSAPLKIRPFDLKVCLNHDLSSPWILCDLKTKMCGPLINYFDTL